MPLTINLLHEEQFLLQQRKRDPLKLGLYALGAVAMLFFLYYAVRFASSGVLRGQLRDRQAEWAKQEPAAKAAAAREADLSAKLAEADAVTKRMESRFYWAPLLDGLLKTVPPNVQVVNLTGTNDPKADKVSVLLEGIVAGEVPRIAADQFRTQLNERLAKQYPGATSTFRGLDDTTATVAVSGRALPTARFTIESLFTKPNAAPAPTPTPEPRRKR